jgi:hypothetical protein
MTNSVATKTVNDESLIEQSFEQVLPELQALSQDELIPVNLDVTSAVATAFGVLRELREFRAQIVEELPKFDVVRFDKLEDYTKALAQADAGYTVATDPEDELREVYEEAVQLRDLLYTDVTAVTRRGLLNPTALKDYTGLMGYKNVAAELIALARLMRENFPTIEGKCGTTIEELERATRIGTHVLRVVGQREQGPVNAAAATEMRARAFTLFIRAYGDARRAISFLRAAEQDADTIIPSLYAGRGGSKKKEKEKTEETPTSPKIEAPASPGVSATPSTTSSQPAAAQSGGSQPFVG